MRSQSESSMKKPIKNDWRMINVTSTSTITPTPSIMTKNMPPHCKNYYLVELEYIKRKKC